MDKLNSAVFLSVVEDGSFKAAADRLGYTQAGISYIINAMEAEFGLKLFDREYGGVTLTSEGQALLPDIRQLHACEHAIKAKVEDLKNLESGLVRVATFTSAYVKWLPGILKAFREQHPNIKVEITHCDNESRAAEMVYNNEVDCTFYMGPIRGDIDCLELMNSRMFAVIGSDHPRAKAAAFHPSDLENTPYIEMSYDRNSRLISDVFRKSGVRPQPSYVIDDDFAAMSMAAQGLGYCLFSEFLTKDLSFDAVCLPLDPPISFPVGLATRSLDSCTRATEAFIRCAVEWVHGHGY